MPPFQKKLPMSAALRQGGEGVVDPQDVKSAPTLGALKQARPKMPSMPKAPSGPKAPRAPQMPKMPGGKFR